MVFITYVKYYYCTCQSMKVLFQSMPSMVLTLQSGSSSYYWIVDMLLPINAMETNLGWLDFLNHTFYKHQGS